MASRKVTEAKLEHQEACDQIIASLDSGYTANERIISETMGTAKIFNTVMGICDGYFTIASNPYQQEFCKVVEKLGTVIKTREST